MGEATSARPWTVTVPAMGAVVFGGIGWLFLLRFMIIGAFLIGPQVPRTAFLAQLGLFVFFSLVAALFVYAGLHALRGDRGARLMLVWLYGLAVVGGVMAFFLLPAFAFGIASAGAIYALLLPESRAWFAPPPAQGSPE